MSVSKSKRTYKPAAQRKAQILHCALSAFAEHGYHATSIAEVCGRARIGRATLYQYFADKRDLLVALADQIAERVLKAHDELTPVRIPQGARPTPDQMAAFMQKRMTAILQVLFEDRATAQLVLRAGRGADGVVDGLLKRIDDAVLETLEAQLRVAKEAGVIRPLDEHFVARFFLGGFEKIVLSYLDDDRPIDVETIAREAALLELCGILPRHEASPAPRAGSHRSDS